jgi:TfoX/Sxy family transcriptional regulator of competence genes
MFDGYGIYSYDTLFGIIFEDKLYFKTSKQTVADYREAGMKALEMNKHQKLKNFYEVPLSVLEDREALMQWADRAIQ